MGITAFAGLYSRRERETGSAFGTDFPRWTLSGRRRGERRDWRPPVSGREAYHGDKCESVRGSISAGQFPGPALVAPGE